MHFFQGRLLTLYHKFADILHSSMLKSQFVFILEVLFHDHRYHYSFHLYITLKSSIKNKVCSAPLSKSIAELKSRISSALCYINLNMLKNT